MLKNIFLVSLFLFYYLHCTGQSLLEPYNTQSYKSDITLGYIKGSVGANYQFFDNPFFKLTKSNNSSFKYVTNSPKCFGLEFISPNKIFKHNYLILGAYYAEADMAYYLSYSSNINPGYASVGFAGEFCMEGRLMYAGIGFGLYRDIQLYRRVYVELASMLNVGTFIIDKALKDTTIVNSDARMYPLIEGYTMVNMPPKVYSKINVKWKNKFTISYNASKRFVLFVGFTYNIGLPNKAFERSFYVYNNLDLTKPISYEKTVFSNSSMDIHFGLGIRL